MLLLSFNSYAGGVRVIQNPNFDIKKNGAAVTIPTPSGSTWYYWGDDTCTSRATTAECIAGWRTTDTGKYVEVGYASTYGNFGADNNRIVAELNASSQSRLYQPICLQSGETITMNYYFSARLNAGGDPQQVTAGLWNINDTGPIGGALSSQNSNFSYQATAAFTPQTAVFTAPSDGLFQIGLEAVLPSTGSNGNLIDDIRVVLKPLIDLNTNPKFSMPEGTAGSSLQLRVNGTVQTPTVVALRKVSGSASSDVDFTLGTPVGLAGTTPTISHVNGSDLWLVTIPVGEYDAGQGIFGNAKYGVQIPVQSSYDVLREGTEPLIFELQAPSSDGSDPVAKWDRTNPICEGASTNQVEADITEVLPVIKVNKNVIGRVNSADQFTTVIKDSNGNVVSSTSSSLTIGGGVTTTGTTTGLFSAAGKFEADFDQTYTITEVMAAGSVNTLSAYTSSISCTNARVIGPATTLPSGIGQSFIISPKDSDDINCTITNAPLPVITLNKALASTRAAPNDQFTVQIKNGSTVLNDTTNSTSTGSGSTIGAGTTGATIVQPNISYTLTEIGAGSPTADLSLYNTFLSCTNSYTASTTVLPSGNGQSFTLTPQGNDNISCTLTNIAHQPRVTLQKALSTSGRLNAADQFTLRVMQGATAVATGTTTGSGSTITGGVAGPVFLSAGVTYSLSEVMAGGSVSALSAYDSQISCTNTNGSSSTVLPSGSGTSFNLTPQLDDVISCTITNGNPRIRVNKTVTTVRNGTDRFTTEIRTGGAAGTIVSNTTDGGGTLTTAGVGSYTAGGYYEAKSGTTYTITESMTSGTLSNYSASMSCTNATSGSSTVLPSGTASSFNITPQFGDDITCTLTNITQPRIALTKALSTARAADSDEFTVRLQGGAINSSSTTAGTGSTVTAGTGTIAATQVVAGTSYTLSEIASGTTVLANYNARISCTNSYGSSVTTLPSGAGTSFTITPQLGDDISCTLTNGREPRLRLHKTIATGLVDSNDRFTTEIRDNTANKTILSTTNSSATTGGAVTTTGGVGTYSATGVYVATSGTTYNLTESISAGTSGKSQYDTTISCTNNGVAMGSPTGSGQNFTITPVTGDNIVCTLTNSPKSPKITVNKRISGVIDNVAPVDTFRTRIYDGGGALVSNGSSANGTVLTTNTAATVFPQTYSAVTAYTATANTTYTLTEAVATGSTPVANYSTFIDCVNTRSDGPFTTLPDGAGQSFNLTVKHGDNITCTLDNGPAQIILKKALANNRLADTDEFTMQIKNSGGTVLNSTVSSTTAGQDDVVTSGSGTTDVTYVPANGSNVYTLTEVASGGTTMTNYETRIDCTNAKVGSTTVLPSTTVGTFNSTQSYTVTPIVGDVITCTMTNKRTAPRIRIYKVLGGERYAAADQFTLEVRNAANTSTLATVTTTGTGSNITGTGYPLNYTATTGTTYTIREIMAGGSSSILSDYINSYSCVNNATGVTTSGTGTSLSFTAAKYDDLECTFTNTPRPRIKVNKTVNVSLIDSADRFTTQIRTGGVSGTVVSGTTSSATTGGGVVTTAIASFPSTATATGSYQAVAGTALTITEVISAGSSNINQYQASISCTNSKTDSTTILPSGSTSPFTVTPQNGDFITCTLSNTPLPRINTSDRIIR